MLSLGGSQDERVRFKCGNGSPAAVREGCVLQAGQIEPVSQRIPKKSQATERNTLTIINFQIYQGNSLESTPWLILGTDSLNVSLGIFFFSFSSYFLFTTKTLLHRDAGARDESSSLFVDNEKENLFSMQAQSQRRHSEPGLVPALWKCIWFQGSSSCVPQLLILVAKLQGLTNTVSTQL